ncbi:MCP methyltransferase/methylesterase, CheR/CheB with PAS/PAC sensor [Candidatus Moduliflexus flocculans]|uniref:protein-glutamate O-methyltransferase n=1 Tax=Candidatus Moduliflexus flocculans TaxID=1499966 RepID=A0A0S6VZ54_9BACT|nr:MCP methyltransferase/methylesterase, CheR/CheB with PAS/PAC sensor [Candidatus Moduliflexus flocculans]
MRKKKMKHHTPPQPDVAPSSPPGAPDEKPGDPGFPIIGLGASAGGLEALEQFFANLPPDDRDMAFVIIQHLDPNYKSLMGELLQKYTPLRLLDIQDGMTIEPGCIYLNPPNKNVALLHGVFQLVEPTTSHGLNLPIDSFFRSLAEDQSLNAIGIILSGTGSDGTLGLKALKSAGGMTIVQEERQAAYSGMPRSAIESGIADMVLPVEQMPSAIRRYIEHPYLDLTAKPGAVSENFTNALHKIFTLLRSQTGHDFSNYKETTICRRIERRMALQRIASMSEYVRYLQGSPIEMRSLFDDMLIGVTNFFRDPDVFDALSSAILPDIMRQRDPDAPFRVWVAGCSTGEEAYSLAILLTEIAERLNMRCAIQIFASDLDSRAIEYARNAVYPNSIAADVSPERLRRFFLQEDDTYRIKKQIRELVIFAQQNLIKDPPFSKLDVVSCRNLLIYLKPELQKKILPLFHYTLNPNGLLLLGTSESIGDFTESFAPLDQKHKIFQRRERIVERALLYPIMPFFESTPTMPHINSKQSAEKINFQGAIEKIVIEDYAPPCVIINEKGRVLYFSGRTDKFLEPPSGEAVFDILVMARQGLKPALKDAIQDVAIHKKVARRDGLRVRQNGTLRTVDLVVRPLHEPAFPSGTLLIVFYERSLAETPSPASVHAPDEHGKDATYLEALELELQSTKESLQVTIEELETSNEELKSANEELQSLNEEMQSSNEELKTSKEELQSANEELTTVNTELQHKVNELSRANNDINNLLASTDIATIFLDIHLRIKRFTPAMKTLFNLISADIGRPISDLTSNLLYDDFARDAAATLDSLARKTVDIQSREGRWYSTRIAPYRTTDNIIDGVVVTFVDITDARQRDEALREAEQAQQDARAYAESIVETIREPLLVLDAESKVQSANKAFYRMFCVTPEQTLNRSVYDIGDRQWDIPKLHELLETIIRENSSFDDYEVEHDFPEIGRKTMRLNARRIDRTGDRPPLILLAIEDVTP